MEKKSNKTIVLEAYKYLIGQCNTALVDTYVSDTYIQHSPMVKDGKAGLIEMLDMLKKMPRKADAGSPIVRAMADGDFVAVHLDLEFMGKRLAVIDIFRLQDGKLAEHWDAAQEYPAGIHTNITMTNGVTTVEQNEDTVKNKRLIEGFCNELFQNRDETAAAKYLHAGYVEHDLEVLIANGKQADFLSERLKNLSIETCRILGEGNFAVVQSRGLKENRLFAFYDIFRIEQDKLAEHWGVQQQVPELMAHSNGMI